jgi:hypothetical protein
MVIGRRAAVEARKSLRHGGYFRNERYDGMDGLEATAPGAGGALQRRAA